MKYTNEGNNAGVIGRREILIGGAAGIGLGAVMSTHAVMAQSPDTATASSSSPYIPKPAILKYRFKIQNSDLNPDGEKNVTGVTVNGIFPGPEIRVTEGEMFRA